MLKSGLVDDSLAVAVIDALTSQICVVDTHGVIIAVNRAWELYGAENGGREINHIGVSYLQICEGLVGSVSEKTPSFIDGLRAVLSGEQAFFQIEYPCHSPAEFRWYLARVSRLRLRSSQLIENIGAVVAHVDITDRKLAEFERERLIDTDPLTGIPNRRFFDAFAALEMDRSFRFGSPTSVLMVDLDKFKSINDAHGHAVGDEVLRRVAALGKEIFRDCDLFARRGGEEFSCLLRGTDEWGAVMAAEKLRTAIQLLSIHDATGRSILITASIGVSAVQEGEASVEEALVRSDNAMYRAKAEGRNCVRTAEYRSKVAGEVSLSDTDPLQV